MIKKIVIIFVVLLLSIPLYAQKIKYKEVRGVIVDTTNTKGIMYAAVRFISVQDKNIVFGSITDSLGKFYFEKLPCDEYDLIVSALGYETKKVRITIPEKGYLYYKKLYLKESIYEFEGVEVVGEQKGSKTMVDKTVFVPDSMSIANSRTGLDLLKKAPGVTVKKSDQSIKVLGSSNVLILVDGVSSNRNINAIDPKDIARIEIIDNPSSKYDSDVANIINIILREDRKKGLSISTNLMYFLSRNYNSFNTFQVEYEFAKVRIFGMYKCNFNRLTYTDTTLRESTLDGILYSTAGYSFDNISKGFQNTIQYGVDYYINKNNTISFIGRNNINNRNTETNNLSNYFINDLHEYYTLANTNKKNRYNLQNYTLIYKKKFKKENQELKFNTNLYLMDRKYDTYQSTDFNYLSDSSQLNSVREEVSKNKLNALNSKLDYSHPLSKAVNIDVGGQLYHRIIDNKYQKRENTSYFKYKDIRTALYGVFTFEKNKFSFQTGIRAERFDINIYDSIKLHQMNYLPSFSALYNINNKSKVKLIVNQKMNYPRYHMLTPFVYYSNDSLSISTGNPYLKPEKFLNIELNYSYKKKYTYISASMFYKNYNNLIGINTVISNNNVKTDIYDNITYSNKYGGFVYLQAVFLDGLIQTNVFNTLYYNDFPNKKYNGFTYSCFLSTEFELPFDMYLTIDASYSGKEYTYNGYMIETPIIDEISLTKSVLRDRGEITIGIVNGFIPYNTTEVIFNDDYYEKSVFHSKNRSILLGFNYFFKKGKQLKKIDRELNMESDEK